MTPKEKAAWLVETYFHLPIDKEIAKKCALIAVRQIVDSCTWKKSTYKQWGLSDVDLQTTTEYWIEVKQEIESL